MKISHKRFFGGTFHMYLLYAKVKHDFFGRSSNTQFWQVEQTPAILVFVEYNNNCFEFIPHICTNYTFKVQNNNLEGVDKSERLNYDANKHEIVNVPSYRPCNYLYFRIIYLKHVYFCSVNYLLPKPFSSISRRD